MLPADAVGVFFQSPESAGAIEIASDEAPSLTVGSRVYTPSLPSPTFGTAIPGFPVASARCRALFHGLGHNGGDRSSGFRSNAGVYNPGAAEVTVTFTLVDGEGGALGTPRTEVLAANEAYQLNDVFGELGAGPVVTANAVLVVAATAPVFPYVTVIDNQTNDSSFVIGAEDVAQ